MGHVYTAEQLQSMMQNLTQMFALVRLVDLERTTVFTIEKDGTVSQTPYIAPESGLAGSGPDGCGEDRKSAGCCEMNGNGRQGYVLSYPLTVDLGEVRQVAFELWGQDACRTGKKPEKANFLAEQVENVWDKVYRDPLTGAYNRRYLQELAFMRGAEGCGRHGLGMIMLDLQQFKRVNDNRGHLEGDRVLKDVVRALERSVRFGDAVIRMGGDEFLVVLVDCVESVVRMRMEQLRSAVCAIIPAEFGYAYSEGVGSLSLADVEELLRKADQMMYREKRSNARQRDMGQK